VSDVCLDTDIASLIQKRREPDWVRAHLIGQRVWLTFVTVGELAKWAEIRSWGPPARERLDRWLAARGVLPYDETVARTWGWLAARAQKRGRPRPHNDMWIAACCIRHGIPLATLNTKDFDDFADLDGLVLLRPLGPTA
jgi:predicted nucleic acid-binding protein